MGREAGNIFPTTGWLSQAATYFPIENHDKSKFNFLIQQLCRKAKAGKGDCAPIHERHSNVSKTIN